MDDREKEQQIKRFISIEKEYTEANYLAEQRNLNKEIINQSYDEEFHNIFADYEFMMTEIINGLNYERQMIESSIKSEYEQELKKIYKLKPLNNPFSSHEYQKFSKSFNNDLMALLQTIEDINFNLTQKIRTFSPSTPAQYIDVRKQVENEWYVSQIKQINTDLSQKIDKLENDWYQTQRRLEEENEKAVLELQRSNYTDFSQVMSNFENIRTEFYGKFYEFQEIVENLTKSVQSVMNSYKETQKEWKEKLKEVQNSLIEAENFEKQRVNKKKIEYDNVLAQLKQDEKTLMQTFEVKKETNKIILDRLRDKIKAEIEELNLQFQNLIPKDISQQIIEEPNRLQKQCNEEMENEIARLENEKKNRIYFLELSNEKMTRMNEIFDQEEDNIMKEFSNLRLANSNETEQSKHDFEQIFNSKTKNNKDEVEIYQQNLKIYLDLIEKKEMMKSKSVPSDDFVEKILLKLTEEEKNAIKLFDNEYQSRTVQQKNLLQETQNNLNSKLIEYKNELEMKNKLKLDEEKNSFQVEILQEKQKYQQIFNDLQTELRSIQISPVNVQGNEDEVNEISSQIEQFKSNIKLDKDQITEDWEKMIFDEGMRSKLSIDSIKGQIMAMDTNLMRMKLDNSKILENLDTKINSLEDKLNSLKLSSPTSQIQEFNPKEEFAKAKLENERIIKNAIDDKDISIGKMQKDISNLNYQFSQRSEDILLEQTKELNNYMLSVQKLQAEHRSKIEKINNEMEVYKNERNGSKNDELQSLKDKILQKKHNIINLTHTKVNNQDYSQKLAEIEKRYKDEVNIMRSQAETKKHLLQCETDIAEKDLNAAKMKFESRESRQEDISLIDKLNTTLNQVTQNLMTLMKDHQEFKTKIVIQENEYNARFGALPSVPVGKSPRIRGSLTSNSSLKILPKL
ncbi:hypothetical protein TVAG_008690 [Trichomonas vaginalis G3]|uniref:Uncharacterized protein n=1 Tax=Trichomonas vaginalis (strain ATCC PRA-98 / G3) TaxID=412133 RepID=A2F7U2_TRIV3|nr:TAG-278-related family [Trichomonas vaginalis G3]EAX99021.1 hypothetical protein TVAG_008690 [Trichomonas vaginalis G3]KAI5539495.1 TAG-278-related family [Trichomonas vaginalis G3]|eukprot:XP_001311951.1 hypothetical protein [Trichomonas vaginalis G3]